MILDTSAGVSILVMAVIIAFTRTLPFLLLSRGKLPPSLGYLERTLPPMIMVLLVLYCLKQTRWTIFPFGIPELASIGVVVACHLWRNNALLSIASGTMCYMFLVNA